jgi:hypothetical protein
MPTKIVIDSILYTSQQNGEYVFRDETTIGYCFINEGNCPVSINNYILEPNSSFKTFETGYIDMTRWQINFRTFDQCSIQNSRLIVLIYNSK